MNVCPPLLFPSGTPDVAHLEHSIEVAPMAAAFPEKRVLEMADESVNRRERAPEEGA